MLGDLRESKEINEKDKKENKEREKKEYVGFICEKTPWFVGDIILCIIDLPNIN